MRFSYFFGLSVHRQAVRITEEEVEHTFSMRIHFAAFEKIFRFAWRTHS